MAAFFSPTAYWLLMLLADGYHIPLPPGVIVWSLFLLILVVALVVGGAVAWRSSPRILVRIGWLVFTLAAMVVQCGFILYVLRAIMVARIGYAQ